MEERLEYDIAWSINPFVHNPYHKRHHSNHGSGSSTPHQNADSPNGPAFITLQQVRVGAAMSRDKARRASVDAHALSIFDNIGTPKASYAELFYDLFFVASLTSFGIKHEITQDQAIASYVAFFTVLWYPFVLSELIAGGCGLLSLFTTSDSRQGTLYTEPSSLHSYFSWVNHSQSIKTDS